jgi:hypothetical protein
VSPGVGGAGPVVLALLLAPALGPSAGRLAAQEDFRAADLDRPIRVEDAFPARWREWEVELGVRGGLAERDSRLVAELGLETGLFLNTEVGLEVAGVIEDVSDPATAGAETGAAGGIEAVGAHLLYNFNRETWRWPAFAARIDVETPGTGEVGREEWAVSLGAIATRSFGRLRLHGNAGYAAAGPVDGDDYWRGGLAFDYPLGLFSHAVLGAVYVELPVHGGRTRAWLEAGSRWQLSNEAVLDLGIATRADEWEAGNANVELVIGLSRVFGIPGLIDVPPYPDPRID